MEKRKTMKDFVREYNITEEVSLLEYDRLGTEWKIVFRMCPPKEHCRQVTFKIRGGRGFSPSKDPADELSGIRTDVLDISEGFDEFQSIYGEPIEDAKLEFSKIQQDAYKLKKFLGKERYDELLWDVEL